MPLPQGRRWEELAPHFEALWGMTLRVIDDIKESVRVAGVTLARQVGWWYRKAALLLLKANSVTGA